MTNGSGDADAGGHEVSTELNRELGIWGAMALGVGTMIAAGIFVLSGLAVSNVGTVAIVAFLIAAVVASFTAFAYAEFAAIYPESGGGYMYVANVFDSDLTYIVGWSMILGYPASAAFYLASFSDWFHDFLAPALSVPAAVPYWASGFAILGLLVLLNLRGTKETGQFQIAVTGLKVALIGLFLFGGLQAFDASVIADSFGENIDQFAEIGVTSALVFITFFGFEAIATNAEEIKAPGHTIPRAIFLSMGVVTFIYVLVVLVIVLAVNDGDFLAFLVDQTELVDTAAATEFVAENGELSMGRAAQYYLGDAGFYVIIVGALISMLSAANATIMAGSRVKLAMARRNHLPDAVEDVHEDLETPWVAVLVTGGLIFLLMAVFSVAFGEGIGGGGPLLGVHLGIEALAHFADFMLLAGLIVVNVAVVQSRRKHPEIERPFRVPGVPWVPAAAVLANLALLVNVEPKSFVIGVAAQLVGVGFWLAWRGTGPTEEELEEETPTVMTQTQPSERDYQIVVPVANPEHVEQLMRTADDLAKANDGEVLVVSVVELPRQTPLEEGWRYTDEKEAVCERAMEIADEAEVPVSATVKIAHHAGDAIINTVKQHGSDAVLMGWRSRKSQRRDFVLGSTVDKVVMDAPCDVLVEKIGDEAGDELDSVLLPVAGGPHGEYAAEIAGALAAPNEAAVTVAHVARPGEDDAQREEDEAMLAEVEEIVGDSGRVSTELLESDDVVDAIVTASQDHDLTVIGATREGLLQQLVFGAVPEEVGRRAEGLVIMAKKNLGVRSRLRHWLRWK
jgi:amino acid transporter